MPVTTDISSMDMVGIYKLFLVFSVVYSTLQFEQTEKKLKEKIILLSKIHFGIPVTYYYECSALNTCG